MKDFVGRDIKAGDYLLQAFNLGRCAAIKFSVVVKVTENNIRATGCKYYAAKDVNDKAHTSMGYGVYNIRYGERSFIVDKKDIPLEVLTLLQESFIKHYDHKGSV